MKIGARQRGAGPWAGVVSRGWLLLAALAVMLLSACGGSGGGGEAAAAPPLISVQPAAPATTDDNGSAAFSITASGTNPRYQWQKNGADVAGATAAQYTLSPTTFADNGSRWRAVVSTDGGSVTSAEVVLTVRAVAPRMTAAPAALAVTAGQPAAFSVTAAGTAPLAFQWQRGGVDINGATAGSYTLAAAALGDSGASFAVRVSNAAGNVTSASVALTVNPAPSAPQIASQPQPATVVAGQTASFSVSATGSAPLAYQWQRNGGAISGASSASYTTPATTSADSGAVFRVVVSNAAGSLTSAGATLTVNAAAAPVGLARIAFGSTHVVAARADGSVIAWGGNRAGQRGNGPAIAGTNARAVATTAIAVAAGAFESLALGGDGIVRGWGRKFAATSIIGGDACTSGTDVPSPVASALPGGVTHIVTGTGNAFALVRRNDGTVWHMPGTATAIAGGFSQAARQVSGLPGIAALGAGISGDPLAIAADGTVWRTTITGAAAAGSWQAAASQVSGRTGAVSGVCNGFSCIALAASGSVQAFASAGGAAPTAVNGLPGTITRVGATGSTFFAVAADGQVWRWNTGATAQLVPGINQVVEVAGGLQSVLFRRSDGSVWGYGPNSFGELGSGTPATSTPVQVPGINLN